MQIDTLVLDGMNVFKTALSTGRGLSNSNGIPTGGFFHGIRTLLAADKNFNFENAVVVWDRAPYWRKKFYPEYKANRKQERTEQEIQEFQTQYEMFQAAVAALGYTQIEAPGFEADDLAYTLSKELKGHTLLWSNDHDWRQLVSKTCFVYSHRVKQWIDTTNFQKVTGTENPEMFTKIKIIAGDGGDNIIGVAGVGPKKAEKFLKGTLSGKLVPEIEAFIEDGRYALNELLVDLSKCPNDPREIWQIKEGTPDPEAFKYLLNEAEITSFNVEQWKRIIEANRDRKFAM